MQKPQSAHLRIDAQAGFASASNQSECSNRYADASSTRISQSLVNELRSVEIGVRDIDVAERFYTATWNLSVFARTAERDYLRRTGTARSAHVRRLTTTIRAIGRNICERDLCKARQRDADLIAEAGGRIRSVPRHDLFPQPRVRLDGRTGLLDDMVGGGLWVIADAEIAPEALLALPAQA